MNSHYLFAAAAALSAVAAPAVAQNYQQPYPQAYPQAYPGYGQPGYAQPGYGQNTGVVGQIIDQLLGNRYNVTDRTAVSQCASAALAQAQTQYGAYGQRYPGQGYGGQYQGQAYGQSYPGQGYNQGYNQPMRVTAVSEVQRRSGGLRVKGLIATGQGYGQGYGNQAYGGANFAAQGDLSFRCNVDYRGAVTNLRVTRNNAATPYRRY
jgi:hypothetical protein